MNARRWKWEVLDDWSQLAKFFCLFFCNFFILASSR
jgi:hypothetical protein